MEPTGIWVMSNKKTRAFGEETLGSLKPTWKGTLWSKSDWAQRYRSKCGDMKKRQRSGRRQLGLKFNTINRENCLESFFFQCSNASAAIKTFASAQWNVIHAAFPLSPYGDKLENLTRLFGRTTSPSFLNRQINPYSGCKHGNWYDRCNIN